MEKKFIKVCESAISRYTRGGILVGDYVEFAKGYKKDQEYTALHDNIKDAIEELIKSGLRIRVSGVDDYYPTRSPGNPDTANGKVSVKISADQGGGRYLYSITVPPCLLTTLDYYPNLAPLPDAFNRDDKHTDTPEEVKAVDGGIKGGDYSLPTQNTVVKPTKGKKKEVSYTANYLKGVVS
jgi:hypothetical protein